MKRQRISEIIGSINPNYIDEATEYTGAAKKTPNNCGISGLQSQLV